MQVAQFTPIVSAQKGSATALFTWFTPPGPLWLAFEHRDRRSVNKHSPKRSGTAGAAVYLEFASDWSYEFESDFNLGGNPNYW